MVAEPRVTVVDPASELGRALGDTDDAPIVLQRGAARFRLVEVPTDHDERKADREAVWANYDPEAIRKGLKEVAGLIGRANEGDDLPRAGGRNSADRPAVRYLVDSDVLIDASIGYRQADVRLSRLRESGLAVSTISHGEMDDGTIGTHDPEAVLTRYRLFLGQLRRAPRRDSSHGALRASPRRAPQKRAAHSRPRLDHRRDRAGARPDAADPQRPPLRPGSGAAPLVVAAPPAWRPPVAASTSRGRSPVGAGTR